MGVILEGGSESVVGKRERKWYGVTYYTRFTEKEKARENAFLRKMLRWACQNLTKEARGTRQHEVAEKVLDGENPYRIDDEQGWF